MSESEFVRKSAISPKDDKGGKLMDEKVCPLCWGRGHVYQSIGLPILDLTTKKIVCPRCNGTGEYIPIIQSSAPSVRKQE